MKKCKIYEEKEIRNLRQKLVAAGCDLVFQPQLEKKDDCAQLVWGVRQD